MVTILLPCSVHVPTRRTPFLLLTATSSHRQRFESALLISAILTSLVLTRKIRLRFEFSSGESWRIGNDPARRSARIVGSSVVASRIQFVAQTQRRRTYGRTGRGEAIVTLTAQRSRNHLNAFQSVENFTRQNWKC